MDSDRLLQFTLGNFELFYEQYPAVTACVSLRCFRKISHILNVVKVVPDSPRSSHLKIWTLFLLAVIRRWDGVFGGFDAFFALLRVVPELSAIFRSPRWRRVLCHRRPLHNLSSAFVDIDIQPERSRRKQQQQQAFPPNRLPIFRVKTCVRNPSG